MPRKKLTKAQVKRKFKTAFNAMYDLWLDKVGWGSDSFSPLSTKGSQDIVDKIGRAMRRMK